ncbi:MAG: GTPase HflX [Christensenellaceae bacterium]|jgi:GTP-binding protein HflX|nr:GTPase HflX [Christensenellaceae bacterium]
MTKIQETTKPKEKVVLVGVSFNKTVTDIEAALSELKSLADTACLEVVGLCFQNIKEETPATLIGSGKVEEIAILVEETQANVVILDCELTGSQINNISEAVGAKVIDRSILILDIFAGRATTNEGRLQVQLAQLKYTLPRIAGISGTSGRYGSVGVGMRGPGETKLELDKRVIKENIYKLERKIAEIKEQRHLRQQNRKVNRAKSVAIVGYTNAGKSTLMNLITKAGIYADDKLFATLETTTRSLWLDNGKEVLLTDTVGFIDKLPHAFIEAFAATLEEAASADLLIVVVDITNPEYKHQMEVVNKVLKDLGADKIPQIIAYNKSDKMGDIKPPKDGIVISAKKNMGIEELKQKIGKILF